MKQSLGLMGLALAVFAVPSFGLEINCVRDQRAVDGDMVAVRLQVDKQGNGTATIVKEGASPALSFSEKATLRAMSCQENAQSELTVDCKGINKLNVSEIELVGAGGTGFSRRVVVTTSYKNQSFTFNRGPIGTGAIKNGCVVTH